MLAACLSLVALQMSGLHMHVNANGFAGTPEGTHLHDAHHHDSPAHHDSAPIAHEHAAHEHTAHEHAAGQGHTSDTDISIFELNTALSKLPLDLIAPALFLLMVLQPADTISPVASVSRQVRRHERWRPPLRAPPLFS